LVLHISGRFLVGQGPLIVDALRPHLDTSFSVGFHWTVDHPDAETSARQYTTLRKKPTSMSPAGFEPTIPPSERPKTHALDRAASAIYLFTHNVFVLFSIKLVI
jgi:hypothetical protein